MNKTNVNVEGKSGKNAANMFTKKYKNLFNSVKDDDKGKETQEQINMMINKNMNINIKMG